MDKPKAIPVYLVAAPANVATKREAIAQQKAISRRTKYMAAFGLLLAIAATALYTETILGDNVGDAVGFCTQTNQLSEAAMTECLKQSVQAYVADLSDARFNALMLLLIACILMGGIVADLPEVIKTWASGRRAK